MKIFRIEDGATHHVLAEDHAAARAEWVKACIAQHGYRDEAAVLAEFGEPEIRILQTVDAARVLVTDCQTMETCQHCHGSGKAERRVSLLQFAREQEAAGERYLCCSEF